MLYHIKTARVSPRYGMVWYGMVWYGMVWYGMVWYGTLVWYGTVQHYIPSLLLARNPLLHLLSIGSVATLDASWSLRKRTTNLEKLTVN